LLQNNPRIKGLNVTIPYKRDILPYLDMIEMEAKLCNAVNTILIKKNRSKTQLIGFNTDIAGF
jgi:shikimate dehydrogenase